MLAFSRALWPSTAQALRSCGLRRGDRCLDLGCGNGDVSVQLLSYTGRVGTVVGVDADAQSLELARKQAQAHVVEKQVKFVQANFPQDAGLLDRDFDFVFSRLLFSAVEDPAGAIRRCRDLLLPGGRIFIEDVDHSASFIHPSSPSFNRAKELYTAHSGPDLGPQLFGMVKAAGFEDVTVSVAQPVFTEGKDGCSVQRLMLEDLGPELIQAGLTTAPEIKELLSAMAHAEQEDGVTVGLPRIFQVHGRAPS